MTKDRRKMNRLSIPDVKAIIHNMEVDLRTKSMHPLRGRYHTFDEVLGFVADHMCWFVNDGTQIGAISVSREQIERPRDAA